MKNRGSTPILTNAVGVHPRNIHTKFEANPCSGLRGEVEKLKSSRRQQRQRRQRQRQRRRRRRTQPDRYSHTHSLSVTKKAYAGSIQNVKIKNPMTFLLIFRGNVSMDSTTGFSALYDDLHIDLGFSDPNSTRVVQQDNKACQCVCVCVRVYIS